VEEVNVSKFVNFQKRSVQLPPGCKDLIDVLYPDRRRKSHGGSIQFAPRPLKTIRDDSITVAVADAGKYVTDMWHSRAWMRQLVISALDDRFNLHIYGTDDGQKAATAWLASDESREHALRDCFARHGLNPPPPPDESVAPISFVPNVPVQVVYPLSPIPAEATVMSDLVMLLLREICGLNAESEIRVHYFEAEEA